MKVWNLFKMSLAAGFAIPLLAGCTSQRNNALMIEQQGSFAAGGTVITRPGTYDTDRPTVPDGQTLHGDHAYVFYQIPPKARKYPLVFLHGSAQSGKTWESTPDGREGFQNIFLRRGYGVYLVDQPRRGKAGRSTLPAELTPAADDQMWFDTFRVGNWPDFYPGVQFSRDPEALNQYLRQMTPNTGAFDEGIIADSLAALFDRIGPGILITHSQGGGPGWHAAIRNPKIRAVVAYEPGSGFVFPEGEVPAPMENSGAFGPLSATGIPREVFLKLTQIPIVIYYGDYIPARPVKIRNQDNWRVRLEMARRWAETVNRHGGNARVVHLPEAGLKGNTHFPFSDLNNLEVADLLSRFFQENNLDRH